MARGRNPEPEPRSPSAASWVETVRAGARQARLKCCSPILFTRRAACDAKRRVFEIVGCRRPPTASGEFRSFLAEMPDSAPTYKRECDALRPQRAAPAVDLEI